MPRPHVLILRAPGTNCDQETAFAFETAGATTEALHVNRVLESPAVLDRFQILCIPGGFSFGDDVAAGQIMAVQMRHHLAGRLADFKAAGKLILGICNGFQVIIKSGVLLDDEPSLGPPATLTYNDSGKYEDRWVRLGACGDKCVFLRGIERMYLPVAHGEGKFIARDDAALRKLEAAGQLPLRYAPLAPEARTLLDVSFDSGTPAQQEKPSAEELMLEVRGGSASAFEQLVARYHARLVCVLEHMVGSQERAEDLAQEVFLRVYRSRKQYMAEYKFETWLFTILNSVAASGSVSNGGGTVNSVLSTQYSEHLPFPDNPNGSMADVAGVCDTTGRVLGLMPHPERHLDPTHHPRWTRGEAGPVGDGLQVFVNAVRYFE